MNYSKIFKGLLCVILICLLSSSCSFLGKQKKWKPIKPQRHAFVHTVTWSDETMDLISKWYTGDTRNADLLVKANPTVNPEQLTKGTMVYIPNKLLKTRDVMPRSFVHASKKKKSAKPKPKQVKKPPATSDGAEDEFELFGPR